MTQKTIMVGLVALAFVTGSVLTGAIAFADDDELTSLLCPVGKALTGLILEDDDEIVDLVCDAQTEGPAGPQGEQGIQGETGDSGMLSFYNATKFEDSDSQGFVSVFLECDSGDRAISAGYRMSGLTGNEKLDSILSHGQSQYHIFGHNFESDLQNAIFTEVMCADTALPAHVP